MTRTDFKQIVGKIVDKKNWRQRWGKIKTFVEKNKLAI